MTTQSRNLTLHHEPLHGLTTHQRIKIGQRCSLRFAIAAAMVSGMLVLPPPMHATLNYSGSVTASCGTYTGSGYNVLASSDWPVSSLTYSFSPTPNAVSSVDDSSGYARYYSLSPLGTYTVTVQDSMGNHQGTYSITVSSCASVHMGMTWSFQGLNTTTGTISVGCGTTCNATQGDTLCSASLPILCILRSGAPLPAYVSNSNTYDEWSGGIVATTPPMVPPTTLTAANNVCIAEFGTGWQVAEFHDGWGWNFQAFGGVGNPAGRFWVDIDDQPGAVCW
jgi:hypothetical protein